MALQEVWADMIFSQFFLFCCVGGAGFLVDLSISLLLINVFGVHSLVARIVAWFFAVSFTFCLNTAFSFQALYLVTRNTTLFFRAFSRRILLLHLNAHAGHRFFS